MRTDVTPEQMTFMAEQHLLAGRYADAEGLARQVLTQFGENVAALRVAGISIARAGRWEQAASFLRRAFGQKPDSMELGSELASACVQAGQLAEAVEVYRSMLLIDGDNKHASRNLILILCKLTNFSEADSVLSKAVTRWPLDSELIFYHGVVLAELKRLDEAIATYRRAIERKPDFAEAHANLGLLLNTKGHRAEAIEHYRYSLLLQPNHPEVHCNLGAALADDGKVDDAIISYENALKVDPNFANAHYNLGNAFRSQRRHEDAIRCFLAALKIKPDLVQACSNMAMSCNDLARHDLALQAYDQAVGLQPEWAEPRWNRTLTHLLLGDFARGWSEFDRRNDIVPPSSRNFPGPRWNGQLMPGKTILLNYEMGLGDTLHFVRYVSLVKQRVTRVILECQPELRELFQSVVGADEVIALERDGVTPKYDVQCSLMRLPQLFNSNERSMPRSVPYVSPDPAGIERWAKRMGTQSGRPRVGLVWAGSPLHQNDRERSIRLDDLRSFAAGEIEFFSLQRGPAASQAASPPDGMRLTDLAVEFKNLADTAAVIANLDLVICVDTSVAHLAGAMGKPVWVLLPLVPDWRWMLERPDTPWYPTMRLFRQTKLNEWRKPISELANELARLQLLRDRTSY